MFNQRWDLSLAQLAALNDGFCTAADACNFMLNLRSKESNGAAKTNQHN
jgi:hypothetical protein